ncbi:hypothetical protein [Streptomyces sp. NPDC006195]|uniref:WXG100 family type VII secretion target n=1 Tax=unclassified Streptomyces TaxID=2593676 RepID=UPI0033B3FD61
MKVAIHRSHTGALRRLNRQQLPPHRPVVLQGIEYRRYLPNGDSGREDMGDTGKVLGISTQDLKKAAPTFQEQSKALGDAAKALKESLGALGSPWGDDEQGQKFGDAYSPKSEQIEKGVGILVLGLRSIHAAMIDMADGYVDDDKLIEGMFTKIAVPNADGDKGAE